MTIVDIKIQQIKIALWYFYFAKKKFKDLIWSLNLETIDAIENGRKPERTDGIICRSTLYDLIAFDPTRQVPLEPMHQIFKGFVLRSMITMQDYASRNHIYFIQPCNRKIVQQRIDSIFINSNFKRLLNVFLQLFFNRLVIAIRDDNSITLRDQRYPTELVTLCNLHKSIRMENEPTI